MIKLFVLFVCVVLLFFIIISWVQREISGYLLVVFYEGVELGFGEQFEFDIYCFVIGFDFEDCIVMGIMIEGWIICFYYDNLDECLEYEIFVNYFEVFEDVGLLVIFQCVGDGECFIGFICNVNWNFNGFVVMNGGNLCYVAGMFEYDG